MKSFVNIEEQIEGLVILIHHTGKDSRKGARGHSSFYAAMDAAIEVSRKEKVRFWKTAKVKDSDDNINEAFDLETINVGTDQYGIPETSCVIVPRAITFNDPNPKGKNQIVALEAISEAIGLKDGIPEALALNAIKNALQYIDKSYRASRSKEVFKSLLVGGYIKIIGGLVTLAKNTGSSP